MSYNTFGSKPGPVLHDLSEFNTDSLFFTLWQPRRFSFYAAKFQISLGFEFINNVSRILSLSQLQPVHGTTNLNIGYIEFHVTLQTHFALLTSYAMFVKQNVIVSWPATTCAFL